MSNAAAYEDAFNMLCGRLLGEGVDRYVYECKMYPQFVVKVETGDSRYFANVLEMKFWSEHKDNKAVSQWLAPCHTLSPDGRILLQRRVHVCQPGDKLPDKLPHFLTDRKLGNYGWLGKRLVCIDYSRAYFDFSMRMTKANWRGKGDT